MVDSKFVEAADLRVHYLEKGGGVPLILLHGGTATADASWQESLPRLAKTYRVIR
jgi:pimeloyl-ACP methyl ester carboxylesterase